MQFVCQIMNLFTVTFENCMLSIVKNDDHSILSSTKFNSESIIWRNEYHLTQFKSMVRFNCYVSESSNLELFLHVQKWEHQFSRDVLDNLLILCSAYVHEIKIMVDIKYFLNVMRAHLRNIYFIRNIRDFLLPFQEEVRDHKLLNLFYA